MSDSCALAIFAKTPGLSPVKTRLASSVGREVANRFYDLSLAATAAVAKSLQAKIPNLQIYWAVAEAEGAHAPIWRDFPVIQQGTGGLGDRLNKVYMELLAKHRSVCFIGSDAPHISVEEIAHGVLETIKWQSQKYVIGETEDGGFYFFGSGLPIDPSHWLGVEYSSATTSVQLQKLLRSSGEIERIARNFDIDTLEDLYHYQNVLLNENDRLPQQNELIHWVCSEALREVARLKA